MTFGQKIILCQFWPMKDSLSLGGYSEQTIFQANTWRKTKFYPNWRFCFEWRMEVGRQWKGRLVPLRCSVQDEWNIEILCPDLLTGVWAWGVDNTYFPLFVKGPSWARQQLEADLRKPCLEGSCVSHDESCGDVTQPAVHNAKLGLHSFKVIPV